MVQNTTNETADLAATLAGLDAHVLVDHDTCEVMRSEAVGVDRDTDSNLDIIIGRKAAYAAAAAWGRENVEAVPVEIVPSGQVRIAEPAREQPSAVSYGNNSLVGLFNNALAWAEWGHMKPGVGAALPDGCGYERILGMLLNRSDDDLWMERTGDVMTIHGQSEPVILNTRQEAVIDDLLRAGYLGERECLGIIMIEVTRAGIRAYCDAMLAMKGRAHSNTTD